MSPVGYPIVPPPNDKTEHKLTFEQQDGAWPNEHLMTRMTQLMTSIQISDAIDHIDITVTFSDDATVDEVAGLVALAAEHGWIVVPETAA